MKRRNAGLLVLALLVTLLSSCGGSTVYDDDDVGTLLFPDSVAESAWESTQDQQEQDTQGIQEQGTQEQEPQEQDETLVQAREILAQIAYYGDLEACQMTAQQAHDYAQVIADGIVGNASTKGDYGYFPAGVVLWEADNFAEGYTTYYTNRANVILGDFAADGLPYLYVYSSLVDDSSFEVYGYADGKAQQAFEQEAYLGREGAYLSQQEDGTVQVDDSGSMGAASHGGENYSFANGTATVTYQWEQTYDEELGMWRYIENGVETLYTQDEVAAMAEAEPEYAPPIYDLPYETLDEVEQHPSTLREMIAALNEYATLMSGGTIAPVEVQTLTDSQEMAWAMLQLLVGDQASSNTYARLIDLDRDGTTELILGRAGGYTYIYHWENGTLNETDVKDPGGALEERIYLVQDKETGQYGIYTRGATDITSDNYVFLGYRETVEDIDDGGRSKSMYADGYITYEEYRRFSTEFTYNENEITEADYQSYLRRFNQQYLLGEQLYGGSGEYDTVPIEDVCSALVALFRGKAVSDQILGEFVQRETATVDPEQFTDIYFEILISEAGRYIWQWYMDPVFVDTSDTVTKSGSTLCYDAVDTYGITSIEALRQQSHLYFTYSAISELEGDYIEQDGKLYLPRANGLGGDGYTTVYIESKKISDTQYQLTFYGTWSFQEGTEVTTINYVLEDDQWVLDGYPAGAILASTNSIDQMP